jgi:hypothetical protein
MASGRRTAQDAARERRAAALRANIKRRKAQARARAKTGAAGAPHDSAGIVRDSDNSGS